MRLCLEEMKQDQRIIITIDYHWLPCCLPNLWAFTIACYSHHPPLPPGERGDERDLRVSPACPRLRGDQKKRPVDFSANAISKPFHHGSLLVKIRRVGFSMPSGSHSVTLKNLQELGTGRISRDSGGLVGVVTVRYVL